MKVGDKITLKSYKNFSDYRDHRNQVGVIKKLYEDFDYDDKDDLTIQIVWEDKTISSVAQNNVIPEKVNNWKERMEDEH